jgi:hypothetical protein
MRTFDIVFKYQSGKIECKEVQALTLIAVHTMAMKMCELSTHSILFGEWIDGFFINVAKPVREMENGLRLSGWNIAHDADITKKKLYKLLALSYDNAEERRSEFKMTQDEMLEYLDLK